MNLLLSLTRDSSRGYHVRALGHSFDVSLTETAPFEWQAACRVNDETMRGDGGSEEQALGALVYHLYLYASTLP